MTIAIVVRRLATTFGSLIALGVVLAGPAAAHTGDHHARVGGGLDGFLHPLGGPDHLLAMLAVGVLAALVAGRLPIWAPPAAFVGGLVGGGALGLIGVASVGVELLIAGSVVTLGLAVAVADRARLGTWLLPAAAVAGAVHGNAHGLEAPAVATPVAYVAGFVAATAALHAAGALTGLVLRRVPVGRVLTGAAMALFGAGLVVGA